MRSLRYAGTTKERRQLTTKLKCANRNNAKDAKKIGVEIRKSNCVQRTIEGPALVNTICSYRTSSRPLRLCGESGLAVKGFRFEP